MVATTRCIEPRGQTAFRSKPLALPAGVRLKTAVPIDRFQQSLNGLLADASLVTVLVWRESVLRQSCPRYEANRNVREAEDHISYGATSRIPVAHAVIFCPPLEEMCCLASTEWRPVCIFLVLKGEQEVQVRASSRCAAEVILGYNANAALEALQCIIPAMLLLLLLFVNVNERVNERGIQEESVRVFNNDKSARLHTAGGDLPSFEGNYCPPTVVRWSGQGVFGAEPSSLNASLAESVAV